nr:MAG TPA: hypothetical protein [Caudoviricetes sp.]
MAFSLCSFLFAFTTLNHKRKIFFKKPIDKIGKRCYTIFDHSGKGLGNCILV